MISWEPAAQRSFTGEREAEMEVEACRLDEEVALRSYAYATWYIPDLLHVREPRTAGYWIAGRRDS